MEDCVARPPDEHYTGYSTHPRPQIRKIAPRRPDRSAPLASLPLRANQDHTGASCIRFFALSRLLHERCPHLSRCVRSRVLTGPSPSRNWAHTSLSRPQLSNHSVSCGLKRGQGNVGIDRRCLPIVSEGGECPG